MTRNEIQNELKKLGCNELCRDNKTLVAYNELQFWLYSNKTPMKAITRIWVENNSICVSLYYNNDFDTGFEIK